MGNYQNRGTSQTVVNQGCLYQSPSSGDAALLTQNSAYEIKSQNFIASISVIKNGKDISAECQKALLAIRIEMTSASAKAYQPTITDVFWSKGINDWLATFAAQQSFARQQGWI